MTEADPRKSGRLVAGIQLALQVLNLEHDSRAPTAENTPVAEQLAAISGAGMGDEDARPYRLGLRAADPVCFESEKQISDLVHAGQLEAEELGIDTSTLELLQAIPRKVPTDLRPVSCEEVVATLVTLMVP